MEEEDQPQPQPYPRAPYLKATMPEMREPGFLDKDRDEEGVKNVKYVEAEPSQDDPLAMKDSRDTAAVSRITSEESQLNFKPANINDKVTEVIPFPEVLPVFAMEKLAISTPTRKKSSGNLPSKADKKRRELEVGRRRQRSLQMSFSRNLEETAEDSKPSSGASCKVKTLLQRFENPDSSIKLPRPPTSSTTRSKTPTRASISPATLSPCRVLQPQPAIQPTETGSQLGT